MHVGKAQGRFNGVHPGSGNCALIVALGHRKATRDAARRRSLRHKAIAALRATVNYGPAGVEIDHQPATANDIATLVEFDPTNQGNQPSIEVIDTELAARGFAGAAHKYAAACIKPLHFDAIGDATRIGDRDPFGVERQIALSHLYIAGEDGSVGPVLHLDPVSRDIDRRIGVEAFKRRLARCRYRREKGQRESGGQRQESSVHGLYLPSP